MKPSPSLSLTVGIQSFPNNRRIGGGATPTEIRGGYILAHSTDLHQVLCQIEMPQLCGMCCIETLRLWVGIRPISSSHASYPAYMHGPSCLPLVTHFPGSPPISSSHASYPAYMCSPSCLPLATCHPGSPQDTCGLSGLPHMAYCPAGLLVRTPLSLMDQSSFQDSMHGGTPSGIQALNRKWVSLGHH